MDPAVLERKKIVVTTPAVPGHVPMRKYAHIMTYRAAAILLPSVRPRRKERTGTGGSLGTGPL